MIPHYPPRKRTTGPFEDRITPPPRNGINLSTFAISLTIYPPTCSTGHVYVRGAEFWKFSAARPRKQQSWQTNAGWIGSRPINIKTPNTDDTGGRGREEEGVGRENKKKKKKHQPPYLHVRFPSPVCSCAHSADFGVYDDATEIVDIIGRNIRSISIIWYRVASVSLPRFCVKRRWYRDGMECFDGIGVSSYCEVIFSCVYSESNNFITKKKRD